MDNLLEKLRRLTWHGNERTGFGWSGATCLVYDLLIICAGPIVDDGRACNLGICASAGWKVTRRSLQPLQL